MIIQKLYRYHFDRMRFTDPEECAGLAEGFVLSLRLKALPAGEGPVVLFEFPGTVSLSTRNVKEEEPGHWDSAENFLSCRAPDGSCRVVEIAIRVTQPDHPGWKEMKIGIPLSRSEKEIFFVYTGVYLRIIAGGEVLNENLPVGTLNPCSGPFAPPAPEYVESLKIACDMEHLYRTEFEKRLDRSIRFYTPHGFNTWAGDVVTFFHDGVYHLLYFLDRHHHRNRWGCGAHCFYHMTSSNLIDWTDHGPLFELTEQWQSVGTGTMFFHRGKYYFVFGWHTSRVVPPERTASPLMRAYFEQHRKMGIFDARKLNGRTPSGASYAVSSDGIHFELSGKLIHLAENPSIYTNPDDTLTLCCATAFGSIGGTWHAKDIDSEWTLVNPDFPTDDPSAPMRNSGECPSFFTWNGWRYLIMGVTGFWSGREGEEYTDSAQRGYDIYDGLAVPMAAPWKNNRIILGGWLNGIGWGSCILLRELIQYPDGRLGMKWIGELSPENGAPEAELPQIGFERNAVSRLEVPPEKAHYFEMTVHPGRGTGRFALRFKNSGKKGPDLEFQLNFAKEKAQWGLCPENGFCHEILSIREALLSCDQTGARAWRVRSPDGIHAQTRTFSIEHVDVMHEPFTLRLIQYFSRKLGTTVIDAEIAGQRTMVTNMRGLNADFLEFASDDPSVSVSGFRMYPYRR